MFIYWNVQNEALISWWVFSSSF